MPGKMSNDMTTAVQRSQRYTNAQTSHGETASFMKKYYQHVSCDFDKIYGRYAYLCEAA